MKRVNQPEPGGRVVSRKRAEGPFELGVLQYRDEVASEAAHQRVAWRRLVLYTPYTHFQAAVSTDLSTLLVHSVGQLTPAGDTRLLLEMLPHLSHHFFHLRA